MSKHYLQYVSVNSRRRDMQSNIFSQQTKKLAYSTALIMVVWAFIGLGYPLYNAFIIYIQATKGAQFGDGSTYLTYRNGLIIAVLGVPGALLGGALVEIPRFGRKGTLSVSTI